MTTRRLLWIAIPVLLVVLLGSVGALAWLLLREQSAPIRLVVVGPNTKMRLIGDDGERLLAGDASGGSGVDYALPAPSPDGRQLAYVAADGDGAAIFRLDLASGERKELYRSRENYLFDLAWSPDGKNLVFLTNSPLTVQVVPADGSSPAKVIAAGQPLYFAWSPDSSALLLHLGGHTAENGHLDTYQTGADRAGSVLNDPGFFQAPAWALDGKHFFYAAQPPITKPRPTIADIESAIVRVSADGKEPVTLVSEKMADLRLIRAPNSDQIAYMVRQIGTDGEVTYGALKLVDGAAGGSRVLSGPNDHVTAFFWSPDGTRIAYLTHDGAFALDGARAWHIVDIGGGAVRDFRVFKPSGAFIGLQAFFDAYTFSFSPWSPDGSRIVYGAEDGVYVLDLAAGQATKAGEGAIGMWVGGK
jgi:TolB protein